MRGLSASRSYLTTILADTEGLRSPFPPASARCQRVSYRIALDADTHAVKDARYDLVGCT